MSIGFSGVDWLLATGLLAATGVGVALLVAAFRQPPEGQENAALTEAVRHVQENQRELVGRLDQLTATQSDSGARLAARVDAQERAVAQRLDQRLGQLRERLAVIDAAQANITELSQQMVGLQAVLSNKQARGALGEIQLNDLVSSALPPDAYRFQATLGNGRRADCLITLPQPPGPMVVDAKFPLESWLAWREAEDEAGRTRAGRAFTQAVGRHVRDIAERYIVPGETAESALMFLPSEAVYADLHAHFRAAVEDSFRHRVWIVSPTTLMATLNTVRAVLRDARMREQAHLIQAEVQKLLEDVGRLDDRAGKLQRHFEQATEDIRQLRISTEKVTRRTERVGEMELGHTEDK